MVSVSLVRHKNEALKKLYFKSIIKCFNRVKIDKWPEWPRFTILIFPQRLLCYNKWAASTFIQWWYSVIDFLIVTASISTLLHSWLFIDLSEHHYTTQTSKFNNFFKSFLHDVKQSYVFKVILRKSEVVPSCLEWERCTLKKADENSFKSIWVHICN